MGEQQQGGRRDLFLQPTNRRRQPGNMTKTHAIVYVVDDDDAVRKSIGRLFLSVGLEVKPFASASANSSGKRKSFKTAMPV
jgi:hypothetical protein